MLLFDRVVDEACPVVEETESSTDGNSDLKEKELLGGVGGLTSAERRINMARALGYITRQGHETMREAVAQGQSVTGVFASVADDPQLVKPAWQNHLHKLLSDTDVWYAIDDTELVLCHPDKIAALPQDKRDQANIVRIVEAAKERDRRLDDAVDAGYLTRAGYDAISAGWQDGTPLRDILAGIIDKSELCAPEHRGALNELLLKKDPHNRFDPDENLPEIRINFGDILPRQGQDKTLVNAIISTVNHIRNERKARDTKDGRVRLVTDLASEQELMPEIDHLRYKPFPGADAADYYGSIGIDAFLHATHRALGNKWDSMVAVSTSDVRLAHEMPDQPTGQWPIIRQQASVMLQVMPFQDILNNAHGVVTSLDDILTPVGFPGISVGKSYPLMPRPDGIPLSGREKIFLDLIEEPSGPVIVHQANNQHLDIAVISPMARDVAIPEAVQKVINVVEAAGHTAILYHLPDLYPEYTNTLAIISPDNATNGVIDRNPAYQTLGDLYARHGVYIGIDPALVKGPKADMASLQFGQLMTELITHSDFGPSHDHGQKVILVTDSEKFSTASHQMIEFDTHAAAHGYVKNPHKGETLHIVYNGAVDSSDILESTLEQVLSSSMVRLGGRPSPEADLALPITLGGSNVAPRPSSDFSARDGALPVWQIHLFGSASKSNHHYQQRIKTMVDVLVDELTDQGIAADIRHGNGRTGYMGFFADRYQVVDGLMIPSAGVTTPELVLMEGGGQFCSYRNILAPDIRRRTRGVLDKMTLDQVSLTVLCDGGSGSLAEYYPAAMQPGNSQVMVAMPETGLKKIVLDICAQGHKTPLNLNLKPAADADFADHLRQQIGPLITRMKQDYAGAGVFMTKPELENHLDAVPMPALKKLADWRSDSAQKRYTPELLRHALG